MLKKICISIFITLLIIGGFYTMSKEDKTSVEIENMTAVDIGYSRLRISLPVFVAQEKGFFEKNGIQANLKMYETAQPLMQALLSEKINMGGYTALPITYNGMIRANKKLLFLTTLIEDKDHRISYLLRSKDNKNIRNIEDLRGKRIGILPTIAYKSWLEAILRAHDIDPDTEVNIQQIAPGQQAMSLKNNAVDALFTNDPVATTSIILNVAELLSSEVEAPQYIKNPFPFGSFNVSTEWADKNPLLLKKIGMALDEAVHFINENPQEAKLTMKPYLPEKFRDHVENYPDAKYLSLTDSSETLFQETADLYLDINLIKSPLSLSGLVLNE